MALIRLVKRVQRKIAPASAFPLPKAKLFPTDFVAHFSYHKCLTAYYIRIMQRLSGEFGFRYEHFNSDRDGFVAASKASVGKRVLSLNNRSDIPFSELPPFQATHFVRDPRDLIVSGYRYHLWTREAWCISPQFNWHPLVSHPLFPHIEADPQKFPNEISYQDYLKRLDPERGLLLEMIWRQPHFDHMLKWDRRAENILELRYEDIVGNERAMFQRVFAHYGFHPELAARGAALAEQFSLKHRTPRKTGHVRSGIQGQWRHEFTPTVTQLFKQAWHPLLLHLGYAQDTHW